MPISHGYTTLPSISRSQKKRNSSKPWICPCGHLEGSGGQEFHGDFSGDLMVI